MIHPQILPLILIAAVFLSPTVSLAQQTKSAESNQKVSDTELKEKAYGLLESLATQISTLQSPENRARIGSNIVGSLWSHDEKRARTVLISVAEDIRLGLQLNEEGIPPNARTFDVFIQLRADTIDRVAKFDPELAFDFLKTTEPSYGNNGGPGPEKEKERALTLRLAKQIAANNPGLAVKLGQTSLAQGFSEDLISLLRQLHRKNREQGIALYKEVVRKIRNTKIGGNDSLPYFLRRLADLRPPLADESAFREFVNIIIGLAFENKCDKQSPETGVSFICNQLGSIVARAQEVDPLRAAKLKHLAPSSLEEQWRAEAFAELGELREAADYDGILALARKYPEFKETANWQAFELARSSGNLEQAKKIAAILNDDPETQKRMLDQIERTKATAVLSEAELEEIRKEGEKLTNPMMQLKHLIQNAVRIGANNRSAALKMLDQAAGIAENLKPGRDQAFVRIALALLYCMEKNGDRGFSMMESLMPKLNELIDAAVKLDGFDTSYVRDGEWNMSGNGSLGQLLKWLSENAPQFAWCDFDRAVNMAAQFERAEIRMMAQLKLAQGIVAGPPKRMQF